MHFYQKNISDFNNATRHLTRVERSLFSDAIELYYDTEKPLTSDVKKLERLLLAQSDEEKEALNTVLDEFFVLTDDGYFNKRCNEEILKYQSYIDNKSKAGKASAEQRTKQKSTGVEQVLNKCSTNEQLTNNQYPITNNQEPLTNNQEPQTKSSKPLVLTNIVETNSLSPQKNGDPPKNEIETELQTACKQTWKFYSDAYFEKYQTEPVRNQKVNAIVKRFVQRIGFGESPPVAAHYLTSNNSYYVSRGHSFDCLLADAEKLRMEWITGKNVNGGGFQTAGERRAANNKRAGDEFMRDSEKIIEGDFYNA